MKTECSQFFYEGNSKGILYDISIIFSVLCMRTHSLTVLTLLVLDI